MEIEKNVKDFLDWCAHEVGKAAEGDFHENTWWEYNDLGIKSPIEQILYAALKSIVKFNCEKDIDVETVQGKDVLIGFGINPQYIIGKYRVDFVVQYANYKKDLKCIVVECDSQQFHERTERERRYEKARDRYLQSVGYTVFHYTGTEIIKNPIDIAKEIFCYLTGYNKDDILIDSNYED